jgi:hypothetical protein
MNIFRNIRRKQVVLVFRLCDHVEVGCVTDIFETHIASILKGPRVLPKSPEFPMYEIILSYTL